MCHDFNTVIANAERMFSLIAATKRAEAASLKAAPVVEAEAGNLEGASPLVGPDGKGYSPNDRAGASETSRMFARQRAGEIKAVEDEAAKWEAMAATATEGYLLVDGTDTRMMMDDRISKLMSAASAAGRIKHKPLAPEATYGYRPA